MTNPDANFTEPLRKLLTSLELPTSGIGKKRRLHGADPSSPAAIPSDSSARLRSPPTRWASWKSRRCAALPNRPPTSICCAPRSRPAHTGVHLARWTQAEHSMAAAREAGILPHQDGRMIYLMRHGVYYHHLAKLLTFLDASPDSTSIAKAVASGFRGAEEALAERS